MEVTSYLENRKKELQQQLSLMDQYSKQFDDIQKQINDYQTNIAQLKESQVALRALYQAINPEEINKEISEIDEILTKTPKYPVKTVNK